jgi:cytoskeletal protein RodZ
MLMNDQGDGVLEMDTIVNNTEETEPVITEDEPVIAETTREISMPNKTNKATIVMNTALADKETPVVRNTAPTSSSKITAINNPEDAEELDDETRETE